MKNRNNPEKTLLVLVLALIVAYLYSNEIYCLYIAMSVSAIGIFFNFLANKIDLFWFKLSSILGLVTSSIILGSIYYIVLFPISIVSKIFLKNDLLRKKNISKSNFVVINKIFSKESFEKTW